MTVCPKADIVKKYVEAGCKKEIENFMHLLYVIPKTLGPNRSWPIFWLNTITMANKSLDWCTNPKSTHKRKVSKTSRRLEQGMDPDTGYPYFGSQLFPFHIL